MMINDPIFFAFAIPAVLMSGISKGGFGSSAAFASVPVLAVVLDPISAVALMLPLLLVMDFWNLRSYWRQWDNQATRVMICGGTVGTGVGVFVFANVDADLLRLAIGLIALWFVATSILRRLGVLAQRATPMGWVLGLFWSVVAGLTSFISHAGGPPASIYLLSRGLGKTTFQATTVLVFTVLNILKLPGYFGLGIITKETLTVDILLAPVAVLGAFIGVKLHHRVPEGPFFILIYIALTFTGSKLIYDFFF
jgi:uncharacterized membrane protein YfcA